MDGDRKLKHGHDKTKVCLVSDPGSGISPIVGGVAPQPLVLN